jgi:hypothetical protein
MVQIAVSVFLGGCFYAMVAFGVYVRMQTSSLGERTGLDALLSAALWPIAWGYAIGKPEEEQ